MNKLQLYIYKSLRGFKSVRNINPSENVQRHIRDVRAALKIIDYDPAEKYLFYLLTYVDGGTFFTILRTIPDKPLDHLATTIFIPTGLKISREELAEIVHLTTRMVSNPAVSADELNELHDVFAKEYPVEAEPAAVVESEGREYAYSLYGGDTGRNLEDFFGDKLYQTSFIKYAGLVLVDADLGVTVDATDLSDCPLCPPATLMPPEPANGFMPYIYGRQFNRPFCVSLGEPVEMVWRRSGFEDILQTVEVTDEVQTVEPGSLEGSRKTINRSTFFISSQSGKKQITDADIIVNGVEITGDHTFSYDELKNADVIVRAAGRLPYQATMDLAATSQALISLPEQRRIYRFEMPVKSSELGAPIRFEIHTKRQLTESPIEGYLLLDDIKEGSGRTNHLQFAASTPGVPVRQCFIYLGAALIAGFLLGWLIMGGGGQSKASAPAETVITDVTVEAPAQEKETKTAEAVDPTPEDKAEAPQETPANAEPTRPAPEPAPAGAVTDASIAYLDANPKWTRDELERQPGLAGLFDDMNNYRLDRITAVWGPKLKKSKRFEKVAYHAGESVRKKFFKPEGTYCSGNSDNSITVQSYLNRIDPAKK